MHCSLVKDVNGEREEVRVKRAPLGANGRQEKRE